MKVYYHPGFAAPLGDAHTMPIGKFALVAAGLAEFPDVEIVAPAPLIPKELLEIHTTEYVTAIQTGEPRTLAESQKFPWSAALFPSVCLTNAGVWAAAKSALESGVSAAVASGFHHAHATHGEGFCTFNGLIVAAEACRDITGGVAVLDADLHYGNGTASFAPTRPWLRAASVYGNDYVNNVPYRDATILRHEDGSNHTSFPVAPGAGIEVYLSQMQAAWDWLLRDGKPGLLLYQAGADPYREDPYSPLDLGIEDLKRRDHWVFQRCREAGIPVAWVLAGGYTKEIEKIVEIHLNTFRVCLETYS